VQGHLGTNCGVWAFYSFVRLSQIRLVSLHARAVGLLNPDVTAKRMMFPDVDNRVAKFVQAFHDLRTKLDLETGFEIQIVVSEVDEKLGYLGE
jgi:hypothetical protein